MPVAVADERGAMPLLGFSRRGRGFTKQELTALAMSEEKVGGMKPASQESTLLNVALQSQGK